jgi:Zn-dependent M32 family carboxypeptidase
MKNKEQIVIKALRQQKNTEMLNQLDALKQQNIKQYQQAIDGLYVQLTAQQQHGQTRKKKNYSLELAEKKKKAKEEMKDEANRHKKLQMPLITIEATKASQKKANKAKEDAKKDVLAIGEDIKVRVEAKRTRCEEIVKHYPTYINELKKLDEGTLSEQIQKLEKELKEAIVFLRKTSSFFTKTTKALGIIGKHVLTLGMLKPNEDERLVRELIRGL